MQISSTEKGLCQHVLAECLNTKHVTTTRHRFPPLHYLYDRHSHKNLFSLQQLQLKLDGCTSWETTTLRCIYGNVWLIPGILELGQHTYLAGHAQICIYGNVVRLYQGSLVQHAYLASHSHSCIYGKVGCLYQVSLVQHTYLAGHI
jgi:hypothetical protein